jgi:hypothetical protein
MANMNKISFCIDINYKNNEDQAIIGKICARKASGIVFDHILVITD